jgi:predicted hotdog family 3-hydroxylacyl-ACP dehydratase
MTPTLVIPDGGRIFEGHFPGRPILAGVAQLVLIARALETAPVRAIPFVRFRGVVTPGDRLDLSARPVPGRIAFEARRGGRSVTAGTFLLGRPEGPADTATVVATGSPAGLPPLEALLPHRAPMLFVKRVVGEAEDGMTCEAEIPADCALVEGGSAPAFVGLEAAAQTAAVREAALRLRGEKGGGPRFGYLVGLRDVELYAERIAAQAPMLATAVLESGADTLAHYRAEITIDGTPALRGVVAVFATP